MRRIVQIISWAALAATILPPVLFLTGHMTLDQLKLAMLAATIVWFAATPLWMGRSKLEEELVI
jgi:hypothetical protein